VSLRGPRSTTQDVFDAEMKAAKDLGLPIIFHGGQSARASVSTAELKARGYLTPDLTLVHFVLATQADRDNMAAAGVSLSYTVHGELRVRAGNAGEQLLHMIASSVNVCLSFDANSISPVDMFSSMCLAWDLGAPKDGTSTEKLNAVDFRQVMEMATIKGAKAMGYDKLVGSLTPGKKADLILVRADDLNMVPFANVDCALVRAANAANVDTVIVDGRLMKRGGKLVGIDTQTVTRAAAMSAFQVRKRAGGAFAPQDDTIPTY
jgi:cytosine/adenosine deaminase-related metal-dependent hydrolase